MTQFKAFYLSLGPAEREQFAQDVGTTAGYLHQIAYGDKSIELGLADAMVAKACGKLSLKGLKLTERARFQMRARRGGSAVTNTSKAEAA